MYDIGNFVVSSNQNLISDDKKYNAFTKTWTPSESYMFPYKAEGGQQRRFNHKWLKENCWLAYSKKDEGVYCKVCMLFGPKEAGLKKKTPLGKLVVTPLTKYKHALEIYRDHSSTDYHNSSLFKSTEFIKTYEAPEKKLKFR